VGRTKLVFVLGLAAFIAGILQLPDSKLRVVFCDVGQGDATLLTFGHVQMLIDAGPDKRVGDCLARHMPFFDRTIEVVLLTHPESDHMGGMTYVVDRYSLKHFVIANVPQVETAADSLLGAVRMAGARVSRVAAGDVIAYQGLRIEIKEPEPGRVLGVQSDHLNELGIVSRIRFGDFEVLLTADVEPEQGMDWPDADVLKVAHHGSRDAVNGSMLADIRPGMAVISVGRNSFGHPDPETMVQLEQSGIPVGRTDREGDIVVVSDGKLWWVDTPGIELK